MGQAVTLPLRRIHKKASRVERWRGGVGRSLFSLLTRPCVRECHTISAVLRFHLPLIKPDVRISRIRLSDKDSCVRPRKIARPHFELDQAQLLVQVIVREA
jgi:hypothetical protein